MNLQFESSTICPLSCVECPQRLMKRKRQNMADEVFDIIFNKYILNLKNEEERLGYPPTIGFHGNGEPLLHPNIKDYMLRISAHRPNYRYNLYTNGLLLTEDFIEFLSTLPNDIWLFISFHFYNYDGKRNNYDKLEDLMMKVLNNGKPYDNIKFVFTSHVTRYATKDDLNVWGQIWMSKVPEGRLTVSVNDCINPWTGLIKEENCVTFDACPYADFGHLFIGVTGNVIPCCMMVEEDVIFGNVMVDSYKQIMDKAEKFYSELREHKFTGICRKCVGIQKN